MPVEVVSFPRSTSWMELHLFGVKAQCFDTRNRIDSRIACIITDRWMSHPEYPVMRGYAS